MKLIYKISISIILVLSLPTAIISQVNVGSLKAPVDGALLQMHEVDPQSNNNQTVLNRGMMLPRVKLESTTSLAPAVDVAASDYDKQKVLHVGLMVFNLTEDNSGLQKGAYIWTGSEWQSMLTLSEDLNLEVNPKEIILGSGLDIQVINDSHIDAIWNPESNMCLIELKDVLNGGVVFEDSSFLPPSLSGGSGTIDILAQNVKALSDADIASNPFYEKRSTLNFTVSDASGSKTEVVTLRQFHYKLLVEGYDTEEHNLGKSYTLRVRSNGGWKVTLGGDSGLIDSFLPGISGEDVIGAEFTYTLTNDDNYEGKEATITFSSVDGKFPDQTIVVKGVREYPNSYFVKPGASMEIPVRKAYQVWQDNLNTKITGTLTAELLWQDRKSMVTSVSLIGTDVNAQIKVNTNPAIVKQTMKEYAEVGSTVINTWEEDTPMTGNAVVVLKEDGVTRWSWHLWITDYDPDAALEHKFPQGMSDSLSVDNGMVYSYFNSKNNFVLMDRHIGSLTTDTRSELHRLSYSFQWGRKDPFTPGLTAAATVYNSYNIYDINNTHLPEPPGIYNPDDAQTSIYKGAGVVKEYVTSTVADNYLEQSIKNPLTFYIGLAENDYNWYGSVVDQYNDYLWHTIDGKKTLYDPCPLGWRVPIGGFGSASPWYNLPIEKYKAQPYNAAILDFRPYGFGLWTRDNYRTHISGGLTYGFTVAHGKAVGALYYTSEFSNAISNSSYPLQRGRSAPVRCVRDDNALK